MSRWWNAKKDPHEPLMESYTTIRGQTDRLDAYRCYMAFYTNRSLNSLRDMRYVEDAYRTRDNKFSRIPINIVRQNVDLLMARIGKLRPRPEWQTSSGNFSARRKADRLRLWSDAMFYTHDVYEESEMVLRDAMVLGLGALKVCKEGSRIAVERVFPSELYVDEVEGKYGKPPSIIQVKDIAKDRLMALFPQHAKKIEDAGVFSDKYEVVGDMDFAEQCEVMEAWKLPSAPGEKDGRHVIAIDGVTLKDEPWVRDDLPFCFIRYQKDFQGFYGMSLAELLMGIHIDVNVANDKVHRSMELTANPTLLVENSSGVADKDISNQPGGIWRYSGTPPQYLQPPSVPGDVFNYVENRRSMAAQMTGFSDVTLTSKVPLGLETGAAQRVYHDIETEAFALLAHAYQKYFLEVSKKLVYAGKQIYEEDKSFSVVVQKDRHSIEKVPWKDVYLDEAKDAFVLKVFPSSALSMLPAGRRADVAELMQMGVVKTPEQAARLMDMPDIDSDLELWTAAERIVDRIAEEVLDTGKSTLRPDPFVGYSLFRTRMTQQVNLATLRNAPADRIDILKGMISQSIEQEQAAQARVQQAAIDEQLVQAAQANQQLNGAQLPEQGV